MQKWRDWLTIKNIGLFFLALTLFGLGVLASNEYEKWLIEEQRVRIQDTLTIYKDAAEGFLQSRLNLAEGLEKFVLSRKNDEIERDFSIFAPGLHNSMLGVRNVGIAPEGILTLIYPLRGNEQAINYNILADPNPAVKADMDRAITGRGLVVSDPFQLRQGGLGIAGRKAVFKQNRMWGLVSVVIDVPAITELSGLETGEESLDLALRDNKGQIFWGKPEIFDLNPVVVKVEMADGYWELAGVTPGGWLSPLRDAINVFRIFLVLLGILLMLLCSIFLSRSEGLVISEGKVAEATRSIRIVMVYVFISLLWIFFSDRAVTAIFTDPEVIRNIQTVKGFLFVLVSAMILYWLIEANYGKYLITSKALRSIIQGNRLLVRAKDEKELFNGLCNELVSQVGYEMAWIGILNEKKQELEPVAVGGVSGDFFKEVGFGIGPTEAPSPCIVAINRGKPVIVNDIQEIKEYPEWRLVAEKNNFRAMTAVPLIDKKTPIGVLSIYSSRKNVFTYGDLELLTSFANDLIFGLRVMRFNRILASQKQKLETVLREMGDAVYVTDEKGEIQMVNKNLEEITGFKSENLVGKSYKLIGLIYEKSGETVSDLIKDILGTHRVTTPKEQIALVNKKGQKIAVDFIGTPITDDKGKITGSVNILRDVTKQRKAERMKSEFVSLASHQLRSPLTGIKWFVELLLEGVGKMKPQKAKEYIEKIGESNEKLIDLVNDLLVTSRIEEGKYDEKKITKVSIRDLLEEAYNGVERVYVSKNIKILGLEKIRKEEKIEADKIQMVQVFSNLLANAAAYSPQGSKVAIKVESTEKDMLISIKDQGLGIPQKQQKRIFEKFFRADNVAKKMAGTGLGLYMAKSIVEGHSGEIWFESKEGHGTTFFVKLLIKQK